jgi:DNA repair protein RadA/Sms
MFSLAIERSQPQPLPRIAAEKFRRIHVPFEEFNRVLGGGIVPGSLVLIGGDPGIGKSTLLLQIAGMAAATLEKVLYISAEESVHQVKMRADRLGINNHNLFLLSETNLGSVLGSITNLAPQMVVVDSIQTVYLDGVASAAGSVSQVRECTLQLMRLAKSTSLPMFIVGHVTKEGAIAGPRVLEHIVDTVLYLEGERFHAYRLLRATKNRFGSTNEVGVFEMGGEGMLEVDNPSQAFLTERSHSSVGSAVVVTLEGTRPILVEIQALTTTTSFGLPRRTANGIDFNRLLLLSAVLSKRIGLALSNQDIFVNVVGGLKVAEPAADLGVATAITSSLRDARIDPEAVLIGEIGLNGELRSVNQIQRRLNEAAKLGFRRGIIPKTSGKMKLDAQGLELAAVSSLEGALEAALQ